MAVIERDLDALVCHMRFPTAHRSASAATNLLERTFIEVRRRIMVIGRFPGETSALALVWAVLELTPIRRRRSRLPAVTARMRRPVRRIRRATESCRSTRAAT
jgi:putative transposase